MARTLQNTIDDGSTRMGQTGRVTRTTATPANTQTTPTPKTVIPKTSTPTIIDDSGNTIKIPAGATIKDLGNVIQQSAPMSAPIAPMTPMAPTIPPPATAVSTPKPPVMGNTGSYVVPATPKLLEQRPDRYRFNPASETGGAKWLVSASPNIAPVELVLGEPLKNVIPLLKANGVIVKVGDVHIISPETLKAILESRNPHYDTVANGEVLGAVMGKTVPIIEIDASALKAAGDEQDGVAKYAGVSSVDYIYESELVNGIPMGLIDQINYTLNTRIPRPYDTFEVYNITLEANYSIDRLKIDNKQADGTLDQKKLDNFLLGVNDRMFGLTTDFNKIKRLFYEGTVPQSSGAFRITRQANTTNPDDSNKAAKSSYIIKEPTPLAATQETPTQAAAQTAATPSGPTPAEIQAQVDNAVKAALAAQATAATTAQATATASANAAAERDRKIAQWIGYGFTNADKVALKQPKRPTNFFGSSNTDNVTRGTRTVNVNIIWGYSITQKARVVDPANWTSSADRNKLIEFYGIAPPNIGLAEVFKQKWYGDRNRERMADLLILAEDIAGIERETNKFY